MPEQQSELTQTSQPNTQQDAVSGLLSLLLEQWEDQDVNAAIEHIPGTPGTSDIVNLGAGLEGLATLEELATENELLTLSDPSSAEITISEKVWETVEPQAHAEVVPDEKVDLDAVLFHCFDLIPIDAPFDGEEHGETIAQFEAEAEPVCTEDEIAALANTELRFDEPPADVESWDGSSLREQIFVEEFEPADAVVLSDPIGECQIPLTVDTWTEPCEEALQAEPQIQQPNIIALEPSLNLASFEQPADSLELEPAEQPSAVEDQELGEADLRMLFDSLMSDTAGFDEALEELASPVLETTSQTDAEPLEIESFDPMLAESDENLLGLLLGGITAIHQVSQVEPEPEAAQPQANAEPPAAKAEPPVPKGPVERFVVFRLGVDSYAVPLQRVVETDRMPRVTFVPGLPASLRGISNLRGDIIPIIDLRHAMGLGETEITVANRLVVVRVTGESSVGLIVDGLAGLGAFWVDRSERRQTPEQAGNTGTVNIQLLNGCGEHKGQPVEVLDLDKVLLASELQELAA